MKSYYWLVLMLVISSCLTSKKTTEPETNTKEKLTNTEKTSPITARDFQSEFLNYWENEDTIKQRETLEEWEKQSPNDPELYASYFNYYFIESRVETFELIEGNTPPTGEDAFILEDSLGNTAGYMISRIAYAPRYFSKAMEYIDTGIDKFPDRLDLRFGKTYALGQAKKWDDFTKEIKRTVEHSSTGNTWLWSANEVREGGNDFMLSAIQDYQLQLYNEADSLLINMREIANHILIHYPEHVESLSNLAVTYTLTGEYEKGLEPLLKAEKIAPTDYVILGNIAHAYMQMDNKKMAIKYYEKLIEHGEENAVQFAKQQIELLKQE